MHTRHIAATAIGLMLATGVWATYPQAQTAPAKPAAKPAAAKPAAKPAARPAAPKVPPAVVESEAVQALRNMSAFLGKQDSLALTSNTSLDVVTNQGQSVQMDAVVRYKIKKPDAFTISIDSDGKKRAYYYDGKNFTIYSPMMKFYASADAPPTIRATLDTLRDKYGIALPLEDLFRWNDAEDPSTKLTSAFKVGTATIDGVATDHYAFRQEKTDWQIWIKQGEQPLPVKVVIVDQVDPAHPAYTARLSWTLNPTLTAADFVYTPGADAMRIQLSELAK